MAAFEFRESLGENDRLRYIALKHHNTRIFFVNYMFRHRPEPNFPDYGYFLHMSDVRDLEYRVEPAIIYTVGMWDNLISHPADNVRDLYRTMYHPLQPPAVDMRLGALRFERLDLSDTVAILRQRRNKFIWAHKNISYYIPENKEIYRWSKSA